MHIYTNTDGSEYCDDEHSECEGSEDERIECEHCDAESSKSDASSESECSDLNSESGGHDDTPHLDGLLQAFAMSAEVEKSDDPNDHDKVWNKVEEIVDRAVVMMEGFLHTNGYLDTSNASKKEKKNH